MPSRPALPSAVAISMDDDDMRLRRGIGTALLLAAGVWIGLLYTLLLIG